MSPLGGLTLTLTFLTLIFLTLTLWEGSKATAPPVHLRMGVWDFG